MTTSGSTIRLYFVSHEVEAHLQHFSGFIRDIGLEETDSEIKQGMIAAKQLSRQLHYFLQPGERE